MLKINIEKFLAVAGLNRNSVFAARTLFKNEEDKSYNSWDRLMKSSRVYDETPENIAKAIADSKKSKEK
jgi:hypothetical protein